jgi:hypothetical protein
VGLGESLGDLNHEPDGFVERRAGRGPLLQRLARVISHGDEGLTVGRLVDVENHADVGVVESGGGLGLADEPPALLSAHAQLGREELEGNEAVELEVACAIHHAHAAAAQPVQDFVVGNC